MSIPFLRSAVLRSLLTACTAALAFLTSAAHATVPFAQPTLIPTGNWPVAVYSADVNGDGFPDLIYIDQGASPNQPSTTHVLLNDGKGDFSASATIATVGDSLAIGAIGGSGSVSIAWVTVEATGFNLHLARGKGDGTFNPTATFPTLALPLGFAQPIRLAYLTSGRLNTSGADLYSPELIAEDTANNIVYAFVFNPDGTIVLKAGSLPDGAGPALITPPLGGGSSSSGPGTLVVTGLSSGAAQVFGLGLAYIPGPSFSPAKPTQRLKGVSGIRSLLVQQVDQDTFPDLIAEGANGRFDIFHGNGDGTFATASEGGSGTLDGLTGHGGHLIAETNVANGTRHNFYTATPIGISVLTGNGNLTYTLQGIYNAGPGRTSYAFADFNGDGYPDLAVDSPEGIAILYGNADGSLQSSLAFAAGQPAMSGALGVVTSGGNLDAVVSTAAKQAQILRGNGDGTFAYVGSPGAPIPTSSQAGPAGLWSVVQVADLDGDGNLDLLLTADGSPTALPSTPDGATIQLGDGHGNFAAPAPVTTPFGPSCAQVPGAFYGTSALGANLLGSTFTNRAYDGARYIYNGNHHFPQGQIYDSTPNGSSPCGPFAHNLTIPGVFAPPNDYDKNVSDVIVQADGHLFLYPTYTLSEPLGRISGDLSVNGSLTTPGQRTAPALSSTFNGPAIPVSSGGLGFPAFLGSAAVGDLDGDGNNDLIVAYDNLSADHTAPSPANPNYLYLWFGNGAGKFLTSAKHPVNPVRLTPSRNFYQVAVADLNADKIPDLILSDGYVVSVQYGIGDGTFGPEQHLLAGQGINTISVGDVNRDGKSDLVIANGGTVFGNAVANKEVLTPNPDVNTGGITVLLNPAQTNPTDATGTVTASPEPSEFEGAFTLTASLVSPTNSIPANLSVTFSIDGNQLGTVPVQGPVTTFPVPAYAQGSAPPPFFPGTHALTAIYSSGYASLSGTHSINRGPTSVVLTPTTPIPVPYGGPIDGTFSVTVLDSAYPATGTYSVLDNGVLVAECNNLPLTAVCPYGDPQILDSGPHSLSVVYNGDPINAPSASPPIGFSVVPDSITSDVLVSSSNPANFGSPVTFTATLTGNLAVPTGTVQFLDASTVLGMGTLNASGVATFTTSSLSIGTHPIAAFYPATTNFNAATSNTVAEQIVPVANPIPSQVILSSSVNPAAQGQAVTFTALVAAQGPFAQTASGTITFYDGTAVLGTGVLSPSSIATFATSSLSVGTHSITASFPGSPAYGSPGQPTPPSPPQPPNPSSSRAALPAASSGPGLLPSVSAVLSQVILKSVPALPQGFTITITPDPVSIGVGRTAILLVTVQDNSGFNQPVQLSCAGLPDESACTFTQTLIQAGGGSTTLQVSTAAPHDCGNPGSPYFLGRNTDSSFPAGGVTLAALLLTGLTGGGLLRRGKRRRNLLGAVLLLSSLGGLAMLSGCGHCTDLGTYPGAYTFTVTGIAQGGPITQTQNQPVPMTVTLQ